MKVLVIIAIAVFTGCHANMMWQNQPRSSMETVKDAFWDYVGKATLTTEDVLQKIRESEIGKEINTRISKSADTISQYVVAVHSQVTPLTQELLEKLSQEAEQLKVRLQQDLSSVKSQLQPYADELMSDIQQQVEQLKRDLTPYTDGLDTEALSASLLQKSEELRGNLEKRVQGLHTQLGPQTEELKQKLEQHLQDFQNHMAPLAQNFHTQLALNSEEIQQKLDPYAQDLKVQLTALWESFAKSKQ